MTTNAIQFAVCAFSPCRREYVEANGFGVFCRKECMIDEAEQPGTFSPGLTLAEARADDDAHAQADGRAS
jgi:hypothetical protein